MHQSILSLSLAMVLAVAAPSPVWAIAGFSSVAVQDQKLEDNGQWPVKMVDVLNDPARTVGWNFWFSECPNDVNNYVFLAKSPDDLNRILKKLTAVDAKGINVVLALGKEFPTGGFSFLKKGNNAAAVLAFGNQTMINAWFMHLKEPVGEPGVKQFGVNRYTEPPKAMPPTLTIYVENPAVNVDKLIIPPEITVATAISKEERANRKDDAALKAIDVYLQKRKLAAELR